jgi:hypothetical protein
MIKETVGITGATALLFPPLGIACLACGLPGLLVAGAGVLVTDSLVKGFKEHNDLSRLQSGDLSACQGDHFTYTTHQD